MKASKRVFALIVALFVPLCGAASEGMKTLQSNHSVADTADRLVAALEEKGMTVMNRISHTDNAASVDLSLRQTELVIFGNPKVGTPLMQCAQGVAIDLPQKALIWEDAAGQVWFGYNDAMYLKQRHGIEGCDGVLEKIAGALGNFANAATR